MAKFVDIGLDLQILICTFLRPSNILTLRKTCRTLQLVTRQRTIWVDALCRVCLENTLFLPTFPILDMSDVELEQAAIAPRRWIELSTSFAARQLSNSELRLSPTKTRIIDDLFESKETTSRLILVPGGRYMVHFSYSGLGVWDLGYTSSADCKLIASLGPEGGPSSAEVHATPDGMGLVICALRPAERCSFYEIYPQSETPQLIELASLDSFPQRYLPSYVSPDKIIWFDFYLDESHPETIFRVWDYRLKSSVSFMALIDADNIEDDPEVVATQTTIIILHKPEILIWAIPPLLPQPPNFDDHSPAQFPPVIRVKFPDDLVPYRFTTTWRTTSSWYFDPSKPLYFAKVHSGRSQAQRFKIIINPDFSDATLHFINTIQLPTQYFERDTPSQSMFGEDTLVYTWRSFDQCGIYMGSTLSQGHPTLPGDRYCPSMTKVSLALDARPQEINICPASGRLVYLDTGHDSNQIVVLDFLPHQRP